MGAVFNSDTITIAAYVFYNLIFALGCYPLGILADRLGLKKMFSWQGWEFSWLCIVVLRLNPA